MALQDIAGCSVATDVMPHPPEEARFEPQQGFRRCFSDAKLNDMQQLLRASGDLNPLNMSVSTRPDASTSSVPRSTTNTILFLRQSKSAPCGRKVFQREAYAFETSQVLSSIVTSALGSRAPSAAMNWSALSPPLTPAGGSGPAANDMFPPHTPAGTPPPIASRPFGAPFVRQQDENVIRHFDASEDDFELAEACVSSYRRSAALRKARPSTAQ